MVLSTALAPVPIPTPRQILFRGGSVPLDILNEVLCWLTPRDLIALYSTAPYFKKVLSKNEHIFRTSRQNLLPPVPDPILPQDIPDDMKIHFTEVAYATWIFGGGECMVCGDHVDDLPISFSNKTWICQTKLCQHNASSDFTLKPPEKLFQAHYRKHYPSWIPYCEFEIGNHGGERLYSRARLRRADEESRGMTERQRSEISKKRAPFLLIIMANAAQLIKWSLAYTAQVQRVYELNKSFIEQTAPMEKLRYKHRQTPLHSKELFASPVLIRYLDAYTSSQIIWTEQLWSLLRHAVLTDVQNTRDGFIDLPLPKNFQGNVRCPVCEATRLEGDKPRIFRRGLSLQHHYASTHCKEEGMPVIVVMRIHDTLRKVPFGVRGVSLGTGTGVGVELVLPEVEVGVGVE